MATEVERVIIEGFSGLIEMTRGGRADVETSDSQGQMTTKDCSRRYYRGVWTGLLRLQQ